MKNPLVQFLSLVIVGLLVVFAKTLWWPAQPAADNNSVTTVAAPAATPAPTSAASDAVDAAPLASNASVTAPAAASAESSAAVKLDEATKEKIELSKSTWVGTWGRQLPDPNGIDMDISQLGKPGGKAIPIPYVAPKPLSNGAFIANADGSMSQFNNGRIVNPDGSKARIDDGKLLGDDGSLLGVIVGNEILWTDGSKSSY